MKVSYKRNYNFHTKVDITIWMTICSWELVVELKRISGVIEFLPKFVNGTSVTVLQCFLNRWLSEPGLYFTGGGIYSISIGIRHHKFSSFRLEIFFALVHNLSVTFVGKFQAPLPLHQILSANNTSYSMHLFRMSSFPDRITVTILVLGLAHCYSYANMNDWFVEQYTWWKLGPEYWIFF